MKEVEPFFAALRATPPKIASSRLLNTADRDLGALLRHATEEEVAEVLAFLSPAKRDRIEDEISRMRRVKLPPETIGRIARHLAAHLSGDHPLGPASRYFKPAAH
jgi:hypothetical protein